MILQTKGDEQVLFFSMDTDEEDGPFYLPPEKRRASRYTTEVLLPPEKARLGVDGPLHPPTLQTKNHSWSSFAKVLAWRLR